MNRLQGRTALVTGGAKGIGRGIVLALAGAGARVAVLDIDADAARSTAAEAGAGAIAVTCDIADPAAVQAAVDQVVAQTGGLDILVNNAVYFHYALLTEMPVPIIDRMIDVGLKGSLWALQAATPHLVKSAQGSVIQLSSVAVSFGVKHAAVYTAIKGAIDALTRQQAIELGAHGVRVNALAPGPVSTPGANSVIDEAGWATRRARTPLDRLATVEEVGAAAVYLCSDDARSISGVTLRIDGGLVIAGPQ